MQHTWHVTAGSNEAILKLATTEGVPFVYITVIMVKVKPNRSDEVASPGMEGLPCMRAPSQQKTRVT